MKGIVLAGGAGTRLYPTTKCISKQLLCVYDKPMIYYPISILMQASIRDILIITTPKDKINFKCLLGDGSKFGISLKYAVQQKPEGLAQAFIIGQSFIKKDNVALVLGDNILYGANIKHILQKAIHRLNDNMSTVFGYYVKDPNRFGVVDFDKQNNAISIEEKPEQPKSNYAVIGLYVYTNDVINIAKNVKKSKRGELEITSINNQYLNVKKLYVERLKSGYAWLDTGTYDSMLDASNFIKTIVTRQGLQIACLEEIAYENNWLTKDQILNNLYSKNNDYDQYLIKKLENVL